MSEKSQLNNGEIYRSASENRQRGNILDLFSNCPIPPNELLANLSLFTRRQEWSRIFFMHELYRQVVDIHGVLMEFGVRWGRNLALFEALRGIYEPFNHNRKIVGFDTFEGLQGIDEKDGGSQVVKTGAFSVSENYEDYLEKIMDYHEEQSPISHLKKYDLIKGDAVEGLRDYLNSHPETIIAFAYFDFDIYKPTKTCLELILPHLTRGSIIGFDELNVHDYPGETLALKEVLGLDQYKIRRNRFSSVQSYIVID